MSTVSRKTEKAVLVLCAYPTRKALIEGIDADTRLLLHWVDPRTSVHAQMRAVQKIIDSARARVGGVIGIDDFASAMAVALSDHMGFPSPPLLAVYQAQHKALFAQHAAACSPHYPPTTVIRSAADIPQKASLYPAFVKPAAGSLSAHSFLVEAPEALRRKYEEVAPLKRPDVHWRQELYGPLMKADDPPLTCFLVQPFLRLPQYTVDGYVFKKDVHVVGVTASVFDRAGHSFERFDFPADLEQNADAELKQVIQALITRLGYDHGCFNIEFFVTEDAHVVPIEFNTRLAFQFVPLFAARYGNNYLAEACRLALGQEPRLDPIASPRMSSSCVLRVYEDREVVSVPDEEELRRLTGEELALSVRVLVRPGTRLSDYKQDAYSFRYAIVNIEYADEAEREEKIERIKDRLKFVLR